MRTAGIIVIALACASPTAAQQLTASLDTTAIRIGEVASYSLALRLPGGVSEAEVGWPVATDTLTSHIEVVAITAAEGPDSLGTVRMTYRITSWDTGTWAIPPAVVTLQGRAIESSALVLQVVPTPVDMKAPPRPLKDIPSLPFSLRAWMLAHRTMLLLGALGLLLLGALLWARRRWARRPRTSVEELPPVLPPDVRCLTALAALEAERLWQQGAYKEHQSRATDLLRAYIEERYEVPALERTTDELMAELRVSPLPADERIRLENMLRSADLVKFAKAVPSAAENEQLITSARQFVQATARREQPLPHET